MRRILLYQSLMTASVIAITLVVLFVGRVLARPPTSLPNADDCQLPCWNDLRPGETSINEAINKLRSLGYRPRRLNEDQGIATNIAFVPLEPKAVCEVGLTPGGGGLLRETILRMCETVPLGDILNQIGDPQAMLPIASLMIFQSGQTILTMRQPLCSTDNVTAHATIRYISLADNNLNVEVFKQPSNLPWHGFVPFWRYSQLYPNKAVCPRTY